MKIIGGLGYIFQIIPFLNIVAPILIGIAWIQMGGKTGRGLFKATGIIYIVSFVGAIALAASFALILFPVFSMFSPFFGPTITDGGFNPLAIIGNLGQLAIFFLIFAVIVGILAFVGFILELVSHFVAGDIYRIRWFTAAALLRIAAIIATIIWVAVLITSFSSLLLPYSANPLIDALNLISTYLLTLIPIAVLGLLGLIFSAVAFFKLPE
ncbi:hypothetical protein HRbin01_00202 [archaeon HR01]|nr:hypothetical protein HRbin01_00202 [archaeon HR01]